MSEELEPRGEDAGAALARRVIAVVQALAGEVSDVPERVVALAIEHGGARRGVWASAGEIVDGPMLAVAIADHAVLYVEPATAFTPEHLAILRVLAALAARELGHAAALHRARDTANRAKDDFLANVGHEIRTPMNAVLGMTKLVLDTELTDDQRQWLRTAKAAADDLRGILDDLLDLATIDAVALQPAPFRLRAELEAATRAPAIRAERKGVSLRTTIAADVADALVGDAGRLRQILGKLLDNAVKFTEHGEISLDVTREADALAFAVRDTGIGIPTAHHAAIFEPFTQQDASTTRSHGGAGLGLAIAARLVALMGGELGVDSAPGRGSTFRFTARFAATAPSRPARLIDPAVLLASCDGDAELLGRMIASLRAHLPKALDDANARFDAGDVHGLRERAHSLQGVISTFSTVVATVASELEDEAANHRLETSAALLARLDAMARSLLTSLEGISIEDLLADEAG